MRALRSIALHGLALAWLAGQVCVAQMAFAQLQAQQPGVPVVPSSPQRVATGTGFFITADGYFVTCFHVIVGSQSITLRNLKGQTFAARVVLADRANDLAVLKAEGSFKPLPVGASGDMRRGAGIVTMGFPNVRQQGIEPKVTDGIINSFSGANNDPRVFQVSAPVQTGNSGGPLVNMEGNVVGVVASKLDAAAVARQTGDIPQNVNYAIKSQYLLELLERAGAAEPRLREGLVKPLSGEKPRVVDIVPALEDGIALVVARGIPATAVRPADTLTGPATPGRETPETPPDEKRDRLTRLVTEYRQLQRDLGRINFEEIALVNQVNTLKLMLRFEQGPQSEQRQAELAAVMKKLEDVGTRKAETIRRMNELAVEVRQLQAQNKGST
jgi:S1-C subfamily serine protease